MLVQALTHDSVLWAWVTQAPNHSSWNPIEKSWPIPRRLFTGQHLGSTAYPPGVDPLQGEEPKPDVLRKIDQAGIKDAFKLSTPKKKMGGMSMHLMSPQILPEIQHLCQPSMWKGFAPTTLARSGIRILRKKQASFSTTPSSFST